MVPEKRGANEVSPKIATVFCLKMISRLQDQKNEISRSVISNFATPWTVVCQAPMSMEFSRQEYWSGLPSPGDLPNPGIKPRSPILQADSLPSELPVKDHTYMILYIFDI